MITALQLAEVISPGRTPTAEQAAVIEAPLSPTLVVAGAGSGKTETMSLRIVWLVANGLVAPEEILGLTFTRKAAGELAERVNRQLRRWWGAKGQAVTAAAGPTVATYNSYAASVVADHALRIGHDPGARVLTEGARWQLAHEVLAGFDFGEDLPPLTIGTLTKAVLRLADQLAEHLLDLDEARARLEELASAFGGREGLKKHRDDLEEASARLALRARLVDVVRAYRERKVELGAMDFADQVLLAGRLAKIAAVSAGERARFRVVILDEYQDTSVAQLEFLHGLFGDAHPVMAVGDPNQSIYGWRGASAGGLKTFRQTFRDAEGAEALQLHLSTAWRNDRSILDAANTVAAPLARSTGLEVPPLSPRPGAGPGLVRAAWFDTVAEEAEAVAEFLAELGWGRDAEGAHPSAAVLCRARRQFGPVADALRRRGIPFEVVGLGGLLSVPEVVDVVAALQAAHDPSRGDSLMRLLTSARLSLALADIACLGDWGRHLAATRRPRSAEPEDGPEPESDEVDERSIVEALDSLPPAGWRDSRGHALSSLARERMGALARQLEALRRATYLPVSHLVAEAERLLGLDIELAARGGPSARVHLDRLQDVAEQFTASIDASAATLGAFLDYLAAIEDHEDGERPGQVDATSERVQVLTVHAAKGLEWDAVAVVGLRDSSFPKVKIVDGQPKGEKAWLIDAESLPFPLRQDYRDPDGTQRLPALELPPGADAETCSGLLEEFRAAVGRHELDEDRRVAYVALTRARTHLLLTGYWFNENVKPCAPSTFLTELAAAGHLEGLSLDGEAPETNPLLLEEQRAVWPADPLEATGRREELEAAAVLVRSASADEGSGDTELDSLVELLLKEDHERHHARQTLVPLPPAVSPTALTRLVHDRERFTENLRRPVPREPSVAALRGTLFHHWIEQRYRASSLVDVEELPGAGEELAGEEATALLQENFEASEWASRAPVEIELDLVVPVGGVVVHARPDAIFLDEGLGGEGAPPEDGEERFVVVDWKSGRPPRSAEELRERELQLALYRLAWASYRGIEQSHVRAAFFFAATGETVWSARTVTPEEVPAIVSGVAAATEPSAADLATLS